MLAFASRPSTILLSLLAVAASWSFAQPASADLKSPNGQVVISFHTVERKSSFGNGAQLVYTVTYKGKLLMEDSALQLTLQGSRPLGEDVRIKDQKTSQVDQTYHLVTGKASEVRDHYNALSLHLQETSGLGGLSLKDRYHFKILFRTSEYFHLKGLAVF